MRQRATLKASETGKRLIEQARKNRGWNQDDERWLEQASRILEPEKNWDATWDNQPKGTDKTYAISSSTLKRFSKANSRINANTFRTLCQILELNWEDVVEENVLNNNINLEDAPKLCNFYGRTRELNQLQQWLITEACQLAVIHGVGGIGKAALARQLVENIANTYDYIIWCSFNSASPFQKILTKILKFISENQENTFDISILIEYLRQYRCLIILDNWEEIIDSDCESSIDYDEFLKIVAEETHQSNVLILSRERPLSIELIEETKVSIQRLGALSYEDAKQLLEAEGLSGTEEQLEEFSRRYSNPWILKKIAKQVKRVSAGKVSEIIENTSIYVDNTIAGFLDIQFQRLSQVEKNLIYWIAIRRNSATLNQLIQDSNQFLSGHELYSTLNILMGGHSLVEDNSEESPKPYTLDQVILKYATNKFVEDNYNQIIQVIQNQSIKGSELFITHSFITKDTADEQLKKEQLKRIVKPLKQKLYAHSRDKERLNEELTQIISPNIFNNINTTGYANQNINLLLSS